MKVSLGSQLMLVLVALLLGAFSAHAEEEYGPMDFRRAYDDVERLGKYCESLEAPLKKVVDELVEFQANFDLASLADKALNKKQYCEREDLMKATNECVQKALVDLETDAEAKAILDQQISAAQRKCLSEDIFDYQDGNTCRKLVNHVSGLGNRLALQRRDQAREARGFINKNDKKGLAEYIAPILKKAADEVCN